MPGECQQEPSLYDVLQVRADASSRDITRAYRRLARAWHPDARPVDPGAEARFQAVSDAYELLSDPARRAAYAERRAARAAGTPGSVTAGRAAGDRRRGPPPPPFPSSPPPLWPLGPATAAPLGSRLREAAGRPPVRPGPAWIEPLPGDPAVRQASSEARLLILSEFVRASLGHGRNRPW